MLEDTKIQGDVLESIFTCVPLIDLVPAFQVTNSWKRAVSTSLRSHNKIKPWLLLHGQRTQHPYSTTTHAYDPLSHLWFCVQIEAPVKYISTLRSSHSTLLYTLSSTRFSISFDPLHLTWHQVESPLVWRTDPIVALVGHRMIVAGGGCDFAEDPLALEMYDLEMHKRERCDFMPMILRDTAASEWLSATVSFSKMYVVEKNTRVAYSFDPTTKAWRGPYDLRPRASVFTSSLIGFSNGRLILICLLRNNKEEDNVIGLKLWELDCESLDTIREMGEMPNELLESLKGGSRNILSMTAYVMGDLVYVTNISYPAKLVLCELPVNGGTCSWSSIQNVFTSDDSLLMAERLVFTCGNAGLGDFA